MELHNDISINSSSSHKIPKKIDYWYFEKSEREFREQINYLKAEIKQKDEIIYQFSKRDLPIEKNVESQREYKPVVRNNPTKIFSQMEALDRKYWEAEIKRREESIAKEEGNVSEINETKQ